MVNYFNIASSSSIPYGMSVLTSRWLGGGSSVGFRVIPQCGGILPEVVEMGSASPGRRVPSLAVPEEGCGEGPCAAALFQWRLVVLVESVVRLLRLAWLLRPR